MNIELSPLEARVIGCLIEKQITTPDEYPLSLNALVNACNQKSNRDPVLDLDERAVQGIVDGLSKRHFVVERSGFGSRVPKYQHRFCNTEFGSLKFDPLELAVVCELLVRGPQTPGELRSRASRMAPVSDVTEVEAALDRLAQREDGPFVVRLAREPGRRDSRYAHLFGGQVESAESAGPARPAVATHASSATTYHAASAVGSPSAVAGGSPPEVTFPASRNDERLARLEDEVQALRAEIADLKSRLGD